MTQIAGGPTLRIECSDGTIHTLRIFYGDVDISAFVQAVEWSIDVETQAATANVRFVLPAINVVALTAKDAITFTVYTPDGKEAVYSLAHDRLEPIQEYG